MQVRGVLPSSLLACALASSLGAQQLFNVPIRINMGDAERVDSYGRTWLGDGPGPGDPLDIRPNDGGGTNTIDAAGWSLPNLQPDSMELLGFDPLNDGDLNIFNSIRWDLGADLIDFRLEIPVIQGTYTVNLYFNEACCPARHFQVEIQGEIVDNDVSYEDYDPANPALGRMGRLSFPDIEVGGDNRLRIAFLPCNLVDCPAGTDFNAIINAIEVVSGPDCDHLGLDLNGSFDPGAGSVSLSWNSIGGADGYRVFRNGTDISGLLGPGTGSYVDASPAGDPGPQYVLRALDGVATLAECRAFVNIRLCPTGLTCTVDEGSGEIALAWTAGAGFTFTGYEVRRNGELIATLPPSATTYEDTPGRKFLTYEVKPLTTPADQCPPLDCTAVLVNAPFEIPLRINMGGVTTVDAKGRTWLGDGPGVGDPLSIRPDDASAVNTIENWCATDPASLRALGFDPTNAADRYILSTIRWDNGPFLQPGDASVYYLELPVPNAPDYLVNLYFNECCCPNRHFKVEIQGVIVNDDVSYEDYASPPGLGKAGRLSFKDQAVDAGILRIGLLPCDPVDSCPGVGDDNAILNAVEVITDPCAEPGFRICPSNLRCQFIALGKRVIGQWDIAECFAPTGYEVYRDGVLIQTLPGDALQFQDTLPGRFASYEVRTLVPDGVDACGPMGCGALNPAASFSVPLRINMGGESLVDSRGQLWTGDGAGAGDRLEIRPNDAGGTNTVPNWCVFASVLNADAMRSLGYDPENANDQAIFNTIRWDVGDDDGDFLIGELNDTDGGDTDFRLAIPIPNGTYLVNTYYTECCCPNRHFQVEIEGALLDDDVSSADYSTLPALGRTGRLTFTDITVADGLLDMAFLPCAVCPFDPFPNLDPNAIIDAIEVLPNDTVVRTCPRDLACSIGGAGEIVGSWVAPDGVTVGGYAVFRNGQQIDTLPGTATSFTDAAPPCERYLNYAVAALSTDADFLCPGLTMSCSFTQPECLASAPLRINMGGVTARDSNGKLWLGDGPGAGDPLELRPDDAGGTNWIENWCGVADDSLAAIGYATPSALDRYIFSTIRWDVGGDGIDFRLDIPFQNGEYDINLYFNECCCIARHFKLEIEGEIVEDDVSYVDYNPAAPTLGYVGRLSFPDVLVADESLSIAFLPCPECPGTLDTNAIVNAIEVLGESAPVEICNNTIDDDGDAQIDCADADCATAPNCVATGFHRGDADQNGQLQLTDAVQVLGYLFLGIATKVPECLDAADADDNGQVQLTDAVRILGYLFLGAGPPEPPGPPDTGSCGPDVNDDALDPCTYDPTKC